MRPPSPLPGLTVLSRRTRNAGVVKKRRDFLSGYLMLMPALILFGGFVAYPLVYGFIISLNQWDGFGPMTFVGLRNYVNVVKDELFSLSLSHNVEYALISVPVKIVLSLCMALLLNSGIKGLTLFRGIFFTPVVVSFLAIGLMFQLMLDPNVGVVNSVLLRLHIVDEPILFLANPNIALLSIIGVDIWKWTGYQTVVFLAGLQTIPGELYESSDIDGATGWQKLRLITLPMMRSVTIINVTLCTMGAFSVFDLVFVMTNGSGGPINSTQVLMTYMYKITFGGTDSNMGFGSTVAYILFAIIFAISYLQSRAGSRKKNRE
jgi:ABC-type sugar transport system permease subunit